MSSHAQPPRAGFGTRDDERAATHLSRLGVNPIRIARLCEYAEADDMSLRDFAVYVLTRGYDPPDEALAGDTE